jgi:hypothetical protein
VEVKTEDEMTVMIDQCLGELEEIESAFLRECHLREPRTPFLVFAERWLLSQKELTELRSRAEGRLKERVEARQIHSLGDIL